MAVTFGKVAMKQVYCLSRCLALLALALALPTIAQDRPPALLIEDGRTSRGLAISKVDVEARIHGPIAETRMTLVFRNDENRALAGDLLFPLPPGATVSGYALDVNGTLVDGVAVEKDKGRQVFEKEMRKGVDPGLVEWTRGNHFRTRVFPIPARGTRTVRVSYISELGQSSQGNQYRLPLHFQNMLASFHLRLEVIKGAEKPVVHRWAPANLSFSQWRDGYVTETVRTNVPIVGELIVDLPETDTRRVLVEKSSDGAYYYCLSETPSDPRPKARQTAADPVSQVTIFWDASGSRGNTNRLREIAFLKSWFAARKTTTIQVNFVPFRHILGESQRFTIRNGDTAALLSTIDNLQYDGGTQLGCLTNFPAPSNGAACYFLFTDGLGNFGKNEPHAFDAPLWIFSADQSLDEAFLQNLAQTSGGTFFPLLRLTDQAAMAGMANRPFTFQGVAPGSDASTDLYPQLQRPLTGRVLYAGRSTNPDARLTLNYGAGKKALVQSKFVVSATNVVEGELLRRFWAQKKLNDLLVFQKRNESEITELGKKFTLVTPFTSLMVLETLEQYVEHRIMPPATLAKMRAQYAAIVEQKGATEKRLESEKTSRLLAMWNKRVDWWKTKFDYAANFTYREREGKKSPGYLTPLPGAAHVPETPPGNLVERDASVAFGLAPAEETSRPRVPARSLRGWYESPSHDPASTAQSKPGIAIKEWDPQTPYLQALKKARSQDAWTAYLAQRSKHANSPAFYLDCAEFFRREKQADGGIQVLSNIAELELENPALLRVLAYRLLQLGQLDFACDLFERILVMRPEEPQSFRDLALALTARGKSSANVADYRRALELLARVVNKQWDRFDEIEVIALMELNALWAEFQQKFPAEKMPFPVDSRLKQLLDLDLRIVLTWDADMTDMDLHIKEPSGEEAFYSHNLTTIGGLVSRDFTQGYGPEEYCVRKAMHGTYKIEVNYYGSQAVTLMGPVTVQADVISNFGRPNEHRKSVTLRLEDKKETVLVGEVEF